ncbi:unnamed protein product [Dicrocoelium dendriticum]|nr:unnamed protein product [Dicrocoelium dendriticum]
MLFTDTLVAPFCVPLLARSSTTDHTLFVLFFSLFKWLDFGSGGGQKQSGHRWDCSSHRLSVYRSDRRVRFLPDTGASHLPNYRS